MVRDVVCEVQRGRATRNWFRFMMINLCQKRACQNASWLLLWSCMCACGVACTDTKVIFCWFFPWRWSTIACQAVACFSHPDHVRPTIVFPGSMQNIAGGSLEYQIDVDQFVSWVMFAGKNLVMGCWGSWRHRLLWEKSTQSQITHLADILHWTRSSMEESEKNGARDVDWKDEIPITEMNLCDPSVSISSTNCLSWQARAVVLLSIPMPQMKQIQLHTKTVLSLTEVTHFEQQMNLPVGKTQPERDACHAGNTFLCQKEICLPDKDSVVLTRERFDAISQGWCLSHTLKEKCPRPRSFLDKIKSGVHQSPASCDM